VLISVTCAQAVLKSSRNTHITYDVWHSNCCVIAYVALGQKGLETPASG